jgi:hypothetical protein
MVLYAGTSGGVILWEHIPGRNIIGDINTDCQIIGADVIYFVNYFKGWYNHLPPDIYLADVNGECRVNGIDVVYLVNYLKGGAAPLDGDCE